MQNPSEASKPKLISNLAQILKAKPLYWYLPASLAGIFLLITRIFTVRPTIMQDEYLYTKFSRLLPMSDAPIPDYLFYWLFSSTKLCGPNFYSCGKVINLLLLVILAALIFFLASKFVVSWQAALVSLAVFYSPIGFYASFFMPEILFFVLVTVLVIYMVSIETTSKLSSWIILGAMLALASLAKPHALFMGLVVAAYALYVSKNPSGKLDFAKAIIRTAAAGFSTVIVKFALGFLFAGASGLTLFGTSYSGAISTTGQKIADSQAGDQVENSLAQLASVFSQQIWGQTLAISALFLAPIVLAIRYLSLNKGQQDSKSKLLFIVLTATAVGVFTISLFTAFISVNGSDHTSRLMLRYYDYLVPLMYLIAIIAVSSNNPVRGQSKRNVFQFVSVTVLTLAAIIGVASNFSPFAPVFYDGTSLVGLVFNSWVGWLLLVLSVTLILVDFLKKTLLSIRISAFLLVPLLSFGLSASGAGSLIPSSGSDRFDYAAEFVRGYLDADEKAALTVISHEDYALARALTQIDDANVDYRVVKKGETFGAKFLNEGKDWVLLMGNVFIDAPSCLRLPGNGYVLQKMCDGREFYFSQGLPNRFITSLKGIGQPENWGSWTIGSRAEVNFAEALPAKAKIILTMAVPKYLQDQTFTATVGNSTIEFQLTEEAIDGEFEFFNDSPSSTLTLEIQNARSEKSEGISEDSRSVGIMLYKIKVVE